MLACAMLFFTRFFFQACYDDSYQKTEPFSEYGSLEHLAFFCFVVVLFLVWFLSFFRHISF